MTVQTAVDTPLGTLHLTAEDGALTGAWFPDQRHAPELAGIPAVEAQAEPVFAAARDWLERYFSGAAPGPVPPLAPRGTPFQLRVWQALAAVPYGARTTYGLLAEKTGSSPRAVGGAVGRNPLSLFIPCHRCVGADGRLTGYAGGLARKAALLTLESREKA